MIHGEEGNMGDEKGKWNWKPAEVGGGDSWGGDWRSGGRGRGDVGRGHEEDFRGFGAGESCGGDLRNSSDSSGGGGGED